MRCRTKAVTFPTSLLLLSSLFTRVFQFSLLHVVAFHFSFCSLQFYTTKLGLPYHHSSRISTIFAHLQPICQLISCPLHVYVLLLSVPFDSLTSSYGGQEHHFSTRFRHGLSHQLPSSLLLKRLHMLKHIDARLLH